MNVNGKHYDVDWLRKKVATGLPIDPGPLADFLQLVDILWEAYNEPAPVNEKQLNLPGVE